MLMRLSTFTPEVRRALRVDIVATLLFTVFTAFTGPFNGLILRRDLHATPLQLSVLPSASAACLLLSLVWSRAMRGRRPLTYVVWSTFVARGLYLLVPLLGSAWSFVGLLIGTNLLGTITGPANAAVVDRVYPRAQRGRAVCTVRMIGAVLGIGLALGAGKVFGMFDYRTIFPAAAVLGMAASLWFARMPVPDAPPEVASARQPTLGESWAAVRRDRAFQALLASSFLFGSGIWIKMPAEPLLLTDLVHGTAADVGLMSAAAAVAGLAANAFWGRFVDRRSSVEGLRLVYILGVMVPLISYTAHSPWVLVLAAATDSVATTGLDLIWMMAVLDVAGPRRAIEYTAIGATLAGVRGIVMPLVGGAVIQCVGVRPVYLCAAALMLPAVWILTLQLRTARVAQPLSLSRPRRQLSAV